MEQFLGFAVLTAPLFLIVIWVPVCIAIAFLVGKKFIKKSLPLKITGGLTFFLIALLLPVSDEIAGIIYLNHLCETEAGVKVYQTIELPAEYWDEDGNLNIFNKYGYIERNFWRKTLDESNNEVIRYSHLLSIDEDKTAVLLKDGNVKIGEIITFRFLGGWIIRNFTTGDSAKSCDFIRDPDFSREFYGQLFKRSGLSKGDN